ncbi:DUF1499 domain-containing protein [Brevundimonas sp. SORGH_AS_0993]|uniref:DUF1499 domain-containing protein n=1 Tax=Brevundimonas sp. SORGH_AS_0993 TaxID=3041794 RepID=UPI00278A16D9|nr:DUF1499 domain-containing protein [Brevundimonas sp. SORGH_AS_0993]MDQ1153966.1 hypothetical protein [Brevundimonas sp. SORGH_AS_0993]
MSSRKPVPPLIPWLTALTALPPVLVVAAVAARQFGGVSLEFAYDLLTWTVARGFGWLALAAALAVGVLALRDLPRRGVFAVIALALAGGSVGVFQFQAHRLAQPTPRDVSTNLSEPPRFNALADLHPGAANVQGAAACPAAQAVPSQMLAQQAVSALVDAGFPVVRAATFEVEGVHEGAWFGFPYDAVVRIRPGRTDVRVVARDPRPDGGAACRLTAKIVRNLAAER